MDRARIIIGYEWRAYWRRFSRAGLRGGNQGIVLIFSVLIAIKYAQLLLTASANLANGNSRLLSSLLAAIFLLWLFPVTSSARETLASRKWLHLPLTLRERFIVRTASLLLPPSAWLLIAGSLAICYPLAHARNPVAGTAAGLLFIAFAWLTGLTIAHLLNNAAWRTLFWASAFVLLAVAAVYVIRGSARGDLLGSPFLPTRLVESAAMGNGIAPALALVTLGTLTLAAGAVALWSFKKSLAATPGAGPRRTSLLAARVLPGRLGGLVAKDFRYFRRLLDIYLGLAAALLACVYLIVADVPAAGVFWSFIVVVFLCNAALAFNGFGLDNRAGLDRYGLMPLPGRAIMLSKNLAYLIIAGVQLLPMLLVAGWRLGLLTSALGLVEAAALACAYLTWGNWMSVSHPRKMQFFRFANSGAALVDEMGGIIFGSLPGILIIYLLHKPGSGATVGTALVLLLSGWLYFASVTRFGSRIEQKRERIAAALN